MPVWVYIHDKAFITFIFNFVVEPKDELSSTGAVQLEVLNEIKRMQNIQQQTINFISAPQGQGRVALGT